MSVVTVISRKLVSLLLGILSIFKRLLCFLNLRRRRRNSGAILPMTADNISTSIQQSVPSNDTSQVELESWDSWGAEDQSSNVPANHLATNHTVPSATGKQHSYQSNHFHRNKKPEPEPEPDVDYFEDMQPKLQKTKKILIRKKEDNLASRGGISNRLAMSTDVPLSPGSELETWDDEGESAWAAEAEEDLSWEAEATLREKRRREREMRQQEQNRKKQERAMGRGHEGAMAGAQRAQFSAVRLS